MNCRHCQTPLSDVFIDLGEHPPSNSFRSKADMESDEAVFPLKVFICPKCFLVQVDELKKSSEIFNHGYVYFSSYSSSWLDHARRYTEMTVDRFGLDSDSLVLEVASNDGYLLQYMQERGIPCYGVEPSLTTAEAAKAKGIESVTEFFGEELAADLVASRGAVDLLIGNNVLAHVPDINDFVKGIRGILKDGGVATLEFPHLMRLVEDCQFDTIYHEHFSYLSLSTVKRIFETYGLRVFDVEELPTHGGSLRVFACREECEVHFLSPRVETMLGREADEGMATLAYYTAFEDQANARRTAFLKFLETAKAEGKTVAGYGAAAKGNTFLNYCQVKAEQMPFCVDASPHKQGLFMPGSGIPVLPPSELKERKPDYVVILPWNIKTEVCAQHGYIAEWGGKFVCAIPELEVLD